MHGVFEIAILYPFPLMPKRFPLVVLLLYQNGKTLLSLLIQCPKSISAVPIAKALIFTSTLLLLSLVQLNYLDTPFLHSL